MRGLMNKPKANAKEHKQKLGGIGIVKVKRKAASMHHNGSDIVWAKDIPPPRKEDKIPRHWGPFLYPSSLHLLSGDAGVGKTTLGYNLALSLANGESFLGFKPSRPLRVLY